MPRTHNFNKDLPKDTEAITGSMVLADINAEGQVLVEKLQNKEIDRETFHNEYGKLSAKASGLNMGEIRENTDEAILAGYMANQKKNAIQAVKTCLMHTHNLLQNINDPTAKHSAKITNEELFAMMSAAGQMTPGDFSEFMNVVTSADADDADTYTDPSVHYVIKPTSLVNTYPRRSVTSMKIKEIRKDPTKESGIPGNIKTVAEGAAFTEVELGTKHEDRLLKTFGAYWALTEELKMDSDRAHFIPYGTARLREEFMLKLERIIIYGSDDPAADTIIGFSEEAGIQTIAAALATGAWGKDHLNAFADAIFAIMTNADAYGFANTIVMHPNDYKDLLTAWEDNVGYLFTKLQSESGSAPTGREIPSLWGVPISLSQALNENESWVADTSDSYVAFNGGDYQTQTGLKGDDLVERKETMVMKAFCTQFTRFPKKFYKITITA